MITTILPRTRRWPLYLALFVLLLAGLTAVGTPRAAADPETGAFGTVQVNAGDWMTANGGGVTVYSNGDSNTVSNDYRAPAVGMKWQCVELTQRLYQAKGWHSGYWNLPDTNHPAYDLVDYASSNGLQSHSNDGSYTPVPGDMIVHSPGGSSSVGHVAVVDRISGNTLYAVEQNVATTGEVSAGRATYTITSGVLSRDQSVGLAIRGIVHDPDNLYTNGSSSRLLQVEYTPATGWNWYPIRPDVTLTGAPSVIWGVIAALTRDRGAGVCVRFRGPTTQAMVMRT